MNLNSRGASPRTRVSVDRVCASDLCRREVALYLLLALSCLFDFGFTQLFKMSQRRAYAAPVVVPVNYLVIAILLGATLAATDRLETSPQVIRIGVVTGIAFICSMAMMTWALEVAHVAVVLVAHRLSVVVPVIAALCLWQEEAQVVQFLGLGVAVVGLWLVTGSESTHRHHRGLAAMGIVAGVFLLQGTGHSCLRWVSHAGLDDHIFSVLFFVAVTAGILGAMRVAVSGIRPRRPEILMGVGIGLFNLVALATILETLSRFPAIIFFPVLGCTIVILDSLTAHFGWKEKLHRRAWFGVALAVVAIVMVLGVG